jgi:hypothetical protein
MPPTTPTQSQLLKLYREENEARARKKAKKRYHGVIALAVGACGVAAMLAGLPDAVSWGLWGVSAASWFILKRV